ncbi:type II toxin-antitoxin system VapC family toxin [Anaerolineales bacterium HSG24]|nr:type II toxin-antitoxin system VapC family toxin [Anaerolineales bacterium HSG24]
METQRILLDTSIVIEFLRKKKKEKSVFFQLVPVYNLYASIITQFEVEIGLKSEQHWLNYQHVLQRMTILTVDRLCIDQAITTYKYLKPRNQRIELADLLIGATALSHQLPIATLNTKHFTRIPHLQLVDLVSRRSSP